MVKKTKKKKQKKTIKVVLNLCTVGIWIPTVVSIDLFWVFFMPFCTMEYIRDGLNSYPPPPFSTFQAPKLFFYILKHNVSLYLLKNVSYAQRVRVKSLPRPEKFYFLSPLKLFWLTMTSQIESTIYWPNKNEQFECQISQWRLLRPFEYHKHLNVKLFEVWISNSEWYSNGQFMYFVLCTRPWIPDQYIRKQDDVHFSGIQMVRLFVS